MGIISFMETLNNSAPRYKLAVFFLTIFIIYFPKGGIKIGSIPITWGYLIIFLVAIFTLPRFLKNICNISFSNCHWIVIFSLLPFQSIVIFSFIFNGVENIGFGISLIVSVILLPFVFIILFSKYLDEMDLTYTFLMLKRGVTFVALFGIFLFFYKLYTGSFLEIPFLTVNYGDVGELEDKHINRGGIFKLISTYNNGNIYGVCILMLLPLYELLEVSKLKRILVKTSLILTLSRTVWLGVVIYEILKFFYISDLSMAKRLSFIPNFFMMWKIRRKDLVGFIFSILGMLFFGISVFYMVFMMGKNSSFLFDKSLGGRIEQLDVFETFNWFPQKEFVHIVEIVYISVLNSFGFFGMLSFLLFMLAPVMCGFLKKIIFVKSLYKKSIMSGLIIYLVMAMSDGAFLYIPVMAIYWFLVSLLLSKNSYFSN